MTRNPPPTATSLAQDAGSPHIRLYVADRLVDGARVLVSPAQSHYLSTVMRRGPGDGVRVFNGRDGEHLATIAEGKRGQTALSVGAQLRLQSEEPDLWLAFALLKRGPTDLIAQKATELGASALLPLFTTRTNADRTNVARLQTIATEAAEQSERLTVPVVQAPRALNAVLSGWPAERPLIACFERGPTVPCRRRLDGAIGLLVGPEGGFTDAELDAVRARPFVEAVTLGPRVLRAETAVIVGLALLQAG